MLANERGSQDRAIIGLLVLLGVVAAGVRFNDQLIGLTGDNAAYIILARALVTGSPYDNAEYPWGYPALLAPFLAVSGQVGILAAIPWMKLLTIVSYLASLPLMYLLFRTRHNIWPAFGTTLLFAVNSTVLLYANDIMTELPYTCVSFATLLVWQLRVAPQLRDRSDASATDASGQREPLLPSIIIAGLLAGIAYFIRTVGLALLAAPVLTLLWYRKLRSAVLMSVLLVVLALPWAFFSSASGSNYTSKLLLRDPYNPALGRVSSYGEFAQRITGIANVYMTYVLPKMILPDPVPQRFRDVIAPVLAALAVGGLALRLARRVEMPEIYTILFLLILFAWPWRADRFMLPVYPLMLHYLVEGGMWCALQVSKVFSLEWTVPRRSAMLRIAAASLLLVSAMPSLWLAGRAGAENLGYLSGETEASGHSLDWERFFDACAWLKQNTPPGSIVMSRKSTLVTVYSDRPSLLIPLIPPDQYPDFLREHHVDYVLEEAFPWSVHTIQYLRPALKAHPEMFSLVETTGPPETRIWKVVR